MPTMKPVFATLAAAVALAAGSALAQGTPEGLPQVDPKADPCQNFYQYACGPWMAANPIPADQSRWGALSGIAERNRVLLRDTLETAAKGNDPATRKIGDFYASCMDEAAANAKGAKPIEADLTRIAAVKDKAALAPELARLHAGGAGALFAFYSLQDFKEATRMIAVTDQGGLGLPDRDYYTKDDAKSEETRQAYVKHIAQTFELLGDKPEAAAAKAKAVMRIETDLAKASLTLAERNDPAKNYHKVPVAELKALAPSVDWAAYFKATGAPAFETLNVTHPDFFKVVEQVVAGSSLDDLKAYLAWHLASAASPWLSEPFAQANFGFYSATLRGAKEIRPRWKRCVDAVDQALGEDLGKHYVAKAFGPEHKERMLTMVKTIQAAFHGELDKLDWMGPETKKRAHEKLDAMANKIGYPEKWRDYTGLEVKRDDLVGNVMRGNAFETARQLKKIGGPVDRTEWYYSPPTVNAYYDPTQNDINFMAGILQPPLFNMKADDAVNFGAIGAVIGHEITHGFDDQGGQFDKNGNLENWWTPEDAKRFAERSQCMVEQYSGYTAVDDVKLNGEASLGENIADNGGSRIALAGLRKIMENRKEQKVGGFTADQRFFLGWAQAWCTNMRPQMARVMALSDVHSTPEWRVNGVVANSADFAQAFNCKPGTPMNRGEKACRVW